MTRFDIIDWSDFVRGTADPELAEEMREHLAAAGPSTRRMVEVLRRVTAVGLADRDNPVPAHSIRLVKALASVPRRESAAPAEGSGWRRLRLSLSFDSLAQPAPAGTRNLEDSHREVIFEAEAYRVDLRLEHEVEPRSTTAVGQITHGDGSRPMSRVPVLVFAGGDEIGRTLTSRYGEFQFEALPRKSLDLCVVAGDDFLEIPLEAEPGTGTEVSL